ncbi:uroporphyrinogen-III synthase [Shimia haliotis]|uniref:Uroporphyrinogen-III synthase n=2 Tax=Shimia haliotis TaxID=1280847 RepID=A0A1I4EEN3_9RHOB|nr:uroporphyrinogen-III synthase [Shimia haliotis]
MSDLSPTILITRPAAAADRFVAAMRDDGIGQDTLMSPLLRVEKTTEPVSYVGFTGVIFTSVNGVEAAPPSDLPAWCVGQATAAVARSKGWLATAAGGNSGTLIARITADAPTGPLLHLRGNISRGDVATRLSEAGIATREAIVYDQELCGLTDEAKDILTRETPVVVPLFSPRTAMQFLNEYNQIQGRAPLFLAVLSSVIDETVRNLPAVERIVAAEPNVSAMIDAVKGLLDAVENIEDRGPLT